MAGIPSLVIPFNWNGEEIQIDISLNRDPFKKNSLGQVIEKIEQALNNPPTNLTQLDDEQQLHISSVYKVKNGLKVYHGEIFGNYF